MYFKQINTVIQTGPSRSPDGAFCLLISPNKTAGSKKIIKKNKAKSQRSMVKRIRNNAQYWSVCQFLNIPLPQLRFKHQKNLQMSQVSSEATFGSLNQVVPIKIFKIDKRNFYVIDAPISTWEDRTSINGEQLATVRKKTIVNLKSAPARFW